MRLASGSGANAGAENDHGRAVAEEDSVKVDLSTVDRQTALTFIGLEHFLDRHEAVGEMGAAVFAQVAHIFDGEKAELLMPVAEMGELPVEPSRNFSDRKSTRLNSSH